MTLFLFFIFFNILKVLFPFYMKVYDRAMLCHSVPSSGGFSGGLSTGLTGLQGIPSMVGNASSYTAPSMMASSKKKKKKKTKQNKKMSIAAF